MWFRLLPFLVGVAALLSPASGTPPGVDLKPHTLAAFDRYVKLTEARIAGELSGSSPFLWLDRQRPATRSEHLASLKRGHVISERLETRDGTRQIDIDDGLIHHWIGTVLLPDVTVDKARQFVQQYDRYTSLFSPTIQRAKELSRTGDRFVVQMRTWAKKLTVTVVIDADYTIDYQAISPSRLHSKSVAGNLYLVGSPGAANEKREPADRTSGWLWRLNTYRSFERVPDGTIEQCESVSLTRGIPFGFGWMVRPFVASIPRETLAFTLGRVRTEVVK